MKIGIETKIIMVLLLIFSPGVLPASAQPMKIVASIYPVGDMVKEVGGNRVEVLVLLPPGASPHAFEPTVKMALELSRARIFFAVGAGLDFWGEKLARGAGGNLRVVVLSEGMTLMHEENEHGHEHGPFNPHVWLDPLFSIELVKKVEKALIAADPQGAETYRKRSADYAAKLRALDAEIARTVSTFRIKNFVSFHPAWDYFARRYGLKSVGVIEESPGKEPTPKKLQAIVRAIRNYHIRAVFAEPQLNPKAAEVIAHEAGVKVVMLDPEGGLPGRETYLGLMQYNLRQMKEAMQ